jgi:hypothetical protein
LSQHEDFTAADAFLAKRRAAVAAAESDAQAAIEVDDGYWRGFLQDNAEQSPAIEADGFSTHKAAVESPRPLFRALSPPEEFPLSALGTLRQAAEAIHMMTQAPLAMCGQSVLAAATLAAQPHVDVALPPGNRPLTCFYVTIAVSGERKSSVDRLALRPVAEKEQFLRGQSDAGMQLYASEKTAWDASRDAAKTLAKKGGKSAVAKALNDLGPEPKPPASPMMLVADPTPEALVLHLAQGRPWAGVFTAEGGMLVGGHAFSDEARMRTGALFNCLWDGDPIRRSRVITGQAFLPGRRCAMHVMLQPVAADVLLGDNMLEGLGLLARMLVIAPPSTAGVRMWREPDQVARRNYLEYTQRIRHLLDVFAPMDGDGLDPVPMELDDTARALWIAFHNECELQLADGGAFHGIKGFGAKLAEHAGRLAAVLAFYEHGGAGTVPTVGASHMTGGIALAKHYAAEMLRLIGGAAVSGDLRTAQDVLDWLKGRPERRFYLSEVYQRGPAAVRTAAGARRAVAILLDHGHIRELKAGTEIDGTARKEGWAVVS